MFWIFWKHFINSSSPSSSHSRSFVQPSLKEAARAPISSDDVASAFAAFGNDILCVIDDALASLYLSENWQGITGYAVEEGLGTGLKSLIVPEDLDKITAYLTDGSNDDPAVRFRIRLSDKNSRWFELQPVEAGEDRKTGKIYYKCLLRDVHALAVAQDNYEKAAAEVDVIKKSRSEFLANMNHELRTPLNAIIGFAQMIENEVFGKIGHPKYNDYIGSIQESGLTLLAKVNDLIEIANIDSGKMTLNASECDLVPLIRQAVELQSHRAFEGDVTLRPSLPLKPLVASVDRIRMLQVLTNVISNAIKYNNAGGVVEIYCEKRRDGGINIVVEDNGEGIADSHLQRILSAFSQENSFFARSRNCAGVGLALSKEIVKLHQGRIDIQSEQGKGTLLTIMLPAERTVKKAAEKAVAKKLEKVKACPIG